MAGQHDFLQITILQHINLKPQFYESKVSDVPYY